MIWAVPAAGAEISVDPVTVTDWKAVYGRIEQQVAEGDVLSPLDGAVLDVPVTQGAVVTPGQTIWWWRNSDRSACRW